MNNLASYLVGLDRDAKALTVREATDIVNLYNLMSPHDREPPKYSVKAKKQPTGWRASRKESGSAPTKKASERYRFL